jgi:hypothetical protein
VATLTIQPAAVTVGSSAFTPGFSQYFSVAYLTEFYTTTANSAVGNLITVSTTTPGAVAYINGGTTVQITFNTGTSGNVLAVGGIYYRTPTDFLFTQVQGTKDQYFQVTAGGSPTSVLVTSEFPGYYDDTFFGSALSHTYVYGIRLQLVSGNASLRSMQYLNTNITAQLAKR